MIDLRILYSMLCAFSNYSVAIYLYVPAVNYLRCMGKPLVILFAGHKQCISVTHLFPRTASYVACWLTLALRQSLWEFPNGPDGRICMAPFKCRNGLVLRPSSSPVGRTHLPCSQSWETYCETVKHCWRDGYRASLTSFDMWKNEHRKPCKRKLWRRFD